MEEFLPEAMRLQHGKWMRAASEKGALPGSLIHPLRNVELLMGDGKYLKCHVSIGALADSTTNKEVSARRIPGLRGLWGSTRPTLGLCFAASRYTSIASHTHLVFVLITARQNRRSQHLQTSTSDEFGLLILIVPGLQNTSWC